MSRNSMIQNVQVLSRQIRVKEVALVLFYVKDRESIFLLLFKPYQSLNRQID